MVEMTDAYASPMYGPYGPTIMSAVAANQNVRHSTPVTIQNTPAFNHLLQHVVNNCPVPNYLSLDPQYSHFPVVVATSGQPVSVCTTTTSTSTGGAPTGGQVVTSVGHSGQDYSPSPIGQSLPMNHVNHQGMPGSVAPDGHGQRATSGSPAPAGNQGLSQAVSSGPTGATSGAQSQQTPGTVAPVMPDTPLAPPRVGNAEIDKWFGDVANQFEAFKQFQHYLHNQQDQFEATFNQRLFRFEDTLNELSESLQGVKGTVNELSENLQEVKGTVRELSESLQDVKASVCNIGNKVKSLEDTMIGEMHNHLDQVMTDLRVSQNDQAGGTPDGELGRLQRELSSTLDAVRDVKHRVDQLEVKKMEAVVDGVVDQYSRRNCPNDPQVGRFHQQPSASNGAQVPSASAGESGSTGYRPLRRRMAGMVNRMQSMHRLRVVRQRPLSGNF